MKHISMVLIAIMFMPGVKGQSINIDSCGLDNNRILNKWEIEYFKESIQPLKPLDLENKSFAFAYGNYGKTIIGKKDYFTKWGRDYYTKGFSVSNNLIILTEYEKLLSGGFDYIIVSYSKTVIDGKSRKKLIEKVKAHAEANQ